MPELGAFTALHITVTALITAAVGLPPHAGPPARRRLTRELQPG